jgi:hypothetical protein
MAGGRATTRSPNTAGDSNQAHQARGSSRRRNEPDLFTNVRSEGREARCRPVISQAERAEAYLVVSDGVCREQNHDAFRAPRRSVFVEFPSRTQSTATEIRLNGHFAALRNPIAPYSPQTPERSKRESTAQCCASRPAAGPWWKDRDSKSSSVGARSVVVGF